MSKTNETVTTVNAGTDANPFPVDVIEGGKGKGKTLPGLEGKKKKPSKAPKVVELQFPGEKAEAVAAPPRKYAAENLAVLPEFTRKKVKVADLNFDPSNQSRVNLTDDHTVSEYTEIYKDEGKAKALPPLRVVDTGETYYVFDGFNRGAALAAAGIVEVEVEVYPGSKQDAMFYALRSNANRGLSRTSADCQKAVETVLDDPELFARVVASAKKHGGLNRAMAAACGVSKGLVSKVLNNRGKTFRGDQIVNLPTKSQSVTAPVKGDATPPAHVGSGTTTNVTAPDSPTISAAPTPVVKQEIGEAAVGIALHEMKQRLAQLLIAADNLSASKSVGAIFRTACTKGGYPLSHEKDKEGEVTSSDWDVINGLIKIVEKTESAYRIECEKKAAKESAK